MPKVWKTEVISVSTTPTVFQSSGTAVRYLAEVVSSAADVILDVGTGTTWIEAVRYPAGLTLHQPPLVVHEGTTPRRLRFRTASGTATVIVTYIEQT
jgi:hypothetical protein